MLHLEIGVRSVELNQAPNAKGKIGLDGHLLYVEEGDSLPVGSLPGDRRWKDSI